MDFSIAGIFPMTCLMGFSYHSHILVVTIFPLVLILGFGSLYLSATQASASHKVAPPTLKAGTADKASLYLQAGLMVSFLSLPTSSTALFRTFHCKAFDNGEDYLIADYSINCASAAHQGFMIYSGLMFMVFPIGTPLVYFVLLRAARDRINPPAADSEFQAIRMRSEDSTLTHIRPMYAIYRPSMWYFEIIDVCRRIIMIGVLIFEDDLALRAAIGSIIAIVVAVAYREAEPYSSSTVNSLSTMATWLVAVVYLSGVVITGTPFEYESWALSLVLLGFFLVVIGMAVWLQVVKGSSRVEVEHKMLEQEAREIDLKLSLDEMIGNTDTIRKSELLAEGERLLNEQLDGMRGATNVSVVMTASGEKATHWAELGGMAIKKSFGFHEKDGFNETLYPCYVMEHTTMQAVSRLPFHEDALKADQLEELRNDTRAPSPSHTYFISQNWEGALGSGPGGQGKHPDNSLNTKLLWLKNIKKHLHIPQDVNVWIWIDVCSVPQTDKIAQRKAVSSLCYYCQLCTRFMPLVRNEAVWRQLHSATEAELDAAAGKEGETCCTLPAGNLEAYAGRGWCRVEVLAALCPKKTLTGKWRSGPINIRYRFHHDASNPGIGPMLKETPLFNPMEGGFTSETDRPIVVDITKRIAQRYKAYVSSGSHAWGETLDMSTLPTWLMDAGQKGVVAKITTSGSDDTYSVHEGSSVVPCA